MSGTKAAAFSMALINQIGRPNARVDGLWVQMIDAEFKRCVEDIEARSADPSKRKVKVEFVLEPVLDERGNLNDIAIHMKCDGVVPAQTSRVFQMKVAAGSGEMLFTPASAEGAALFVGKQADSNEPEGAEEGGVS